MHDLTVDAFGVRPLLLLEGDPSQGHPQFCLELFLGEVAFDAVAFGALGIEDQNGRSPGRVEAMEPGSVFLNVGFDGEEIRVDEACDGVIRV